MTEFKAGDLVKPILTGEFFGSFQFVHWTPGNSYKVEEDEEGDSGGYGEGCSELMVADDLGRYWFVNTSYGDRFVHAEEEGGNA
jgi:hypothetical protein